MNEKQTITGKLKKFLFQNNSGWGIALFKSTTNNAQIKIKGNISLIDVNNTYELLGTFQEHPKYGKNFDVESFKILELTSSEQYLDFFKEVVPGIGQVIGSKIIETYDYSPDLFNEILKNPEKLNFIKNLSVQSKTILLKEVNSLVKENKLSTIFFNNNLKMDFLINLKKEYQNSEKRDELIEQILKNNFYAYAKNHHLYPFDEVDKIAVYFQQLKPDDVFRLAWNLNYLIEQILNQTGETYTNLATLEKQFHNYLGLFDHELFLKALDKAIELKLIYQQTNAYFSDLSWNDELTISYEVLAKLNQKTLELKPKELTELIKKTEKKMAEIFKIAHFEFDEQQKLVLETFSSKNILLLNGGPGTGKTTVLKGMVELYKLMNPLTTNNIAIATPTGRAAARINEMDQKLNAKTIHKLLQANEEGFFGINASNPLEEDLLIVDEASMIDNHLFASLLDSAHQVKKLVIIGDENQLASVGYGNVFANLLEINEIDKVKLNQVHRQVDGNGIIDLAYQVLNQEVDDSTNFNLPNITTIFYQENQLDEIKRIFLNQVKETGIHNLQIITSFYKGELGINEINQTIQQDYQQVILKKNFTDDLKHSYKRNNQHFFVDDKVMFLVNDSALSLSNGDVGLIQILNVSNNKLDACAINFNGEVKALSSDNFNSLTLSYACSVHKTQGSEYDNVIFIVEKGVNEFFLTKNLIYTAITRAKKHLYLVGDLETFIKATKRITKPRKTGLVGRMNSIIKKGYNLS